MSDDPFFGRIVSIATWSSVVRTCSTLFPILFPCCLVPLTVCRVNVSWELLLWSFPESQLYLGAHKYLIRVWITTWIILAFPMLTCPFKQAGETFFIAFLYCRNVMLFKTFTVCLQWIVHKTVKPESFQGSFTQVPLLPAPQWLGEVLVFPALLSYQHSGLLSVINYCQGLTAISSSFSARNGSNTGVGCDWLLAKYFLLLDRPWKRGAL